MASRWGPCEKLAEFGEEKWVRFANQSMGCTSDRLPGGIHPSRHQLLSLPVPMAGTGRGEVNIRLPL